MALKTFRVTLKAFFLHRSGLRQKLLHGGIQHGISGVRPQEASVARIHRRAARQIRPHSHVPAVYHRKLGEAAGEGIILLLRSVWRVGGRAQQSNRRLRIQRHEPLQQRRRIRSLSSDG